MVAPIPRYSGPVLFILSVPTRMFEQNLLQDKIQTITKPTAAIQKGITIPRDSSTLITTLIYDSDSGKSPPPHAHFTLDKYSIKK